MLLLLAKVIILAVLATVIVLAVVAILCIGAGLALTRMRKWCPECHSKGLKLINGFLCNPPPNYSFFACVNCGGEFVQVEGYDGIENPMIPRAGSRWERDPGWETSAQPDRRRRDNA
jgi:hypothetical protein